MKIYICGPMTGLPEHNRPAFKAAEAALVEKHPAFTVINPAENFGGRTDLSWRTYMRESIRQVVDCTDLVRLPGWEDSKGAQLEVMIAEALGLTIWEAGDLI